MVNRLETEPVTRAASPPASRHEPSYPLVALARWTWIFLALVTVVGAAAGTLILDGGAGFVVGFVLFLAGLFSLRVYGRRGLSRRARTGMAIVLVLFMVSQITRRMDDVPRRKYGNGWDFSAYYVAAGVLRLDPGANLYYLPHLKDGRMQMFVPADVANGTWGGHARTMGVAAPMPYIYPPFAAILIKPFLHLQFAAAYQLWRALTVLLLLISVLLGLRVAGIRPLVPAFVVVLVGVLSSFPVADMLYLGQTGSVMLALWTLGAYLLLRDRPVWSALSFAVGTMIKMTPILVLPVFLFRKQWKWLGAYCGWMLVLSVISVWQAGWANHVTYERSVLPAISCGMPGYQNRSITALVQNLCLGQVPLAMETPEVIPSYVCKAGKIIATLAFAAILIVLLGMNRGTSRMVDEVVILAAASLLISPVSWRHHYVLALLPFLIFWRDSMAGLRENRYWVALLVIGTVVIWTQLTDYVTILVRNAPLDLVVSGSVPVLMLALILASAATRPTQFHV